MEPPATNVESNHPFKLQPNKMSW